jgi:hypothetical protein
MLNNFSKSGSKFEPLPVAAAKNQVQGETTVESRIYPYSDKPNDK